jgi:hypothetical protein
LVGFAREGHSFAGSRNSLTCSGTTSARVLEHPGLSFLRYPAGFDQIAGRSDPPTASDIKRNAADRVLAPMPQLGSSKTAFTSNRDGSRQI